MQWKTENADINFDWTAGYEDEVRDDKRLWSGYGDMIRRFDDRMTSLTVDFGEIECPARVVWSNAYFAGARFDTRLSDDELTRIRNRNNNP